VTYIKDTTVGDTTTVGSTVFTIDNNSEPGRIYPSYGNEWPSDVRDERNAVTIQYVSGYSTCPEEIKNWIKMRVADMYENREGLTPEQIYRIPRTYIDGILDPYTIPTIT